MPITRFAPSPTGYLHLGHAYAALMAAQAAGPKGRFLVRIEDIDQTRARPDLEIAILADLAWLGLKFEQPVRRQSDHRAAYRAVIRELDGLGVTYPCFCTRSQITAEINASANAPQGPDGPLYPGTCRHLSLSERQDRMAAGEPAWRLDVAKAARITGPLTFREHDDEIAVDPGLLGDVVLARKDSGVAYHLAVVHDDADQGVDLVTRGDDLLPSAHVQRLLQALLGHPAPNYAHHRLILDSNGKRLAKRDGAVTLRDLRAQGLNVGDIKQRIGLAA
jgi:glutamyl-Q tRNA(Asp) synthetase